MHLLISVYLAAHDFTLSRFANYQIKNLNMNKTIQTDIAEHESVQKCQSETVQSTCPEEAGCTLRLEASET